VFDVPSVRIGRIFGIPIEINLSWLIIFGLVAFSLGASYFPSLPQAQAAPAWASYLVGAVTALLFFASIVAHELCHSVVAKLEGGHVDRITLFIFGGVAQIDEEPRSPGKEFLMAAAGPAASLVLSVVSFIGFVAAAGSGLPWWVWAPLEYLAAINLAVAVFNLLPGFPLDGGRVLRSVLWAMTGDLLKATRWAARAGQFIGWAMVAWAVLGVLRGDTGLIWFGLVGWFIASLAGSAYRQQVVTSALQGVPVESIMTPAAEHLDGSLTLDQAATDAFLGGRHSRYPVMVDGAIIGLVTLPDLKAVSIAEWPFVRIEDIARRQLDALVVPHDADVMTLIPRLAGDSPGALIVVKDGRMAGIVTRSDVMHFLHQRGVA